jgi:hypothetical protein
MAVDEATIGQTDEGAVVESEGWFVLNLADVAWTRSEIAGEWSNLEPRDPEFTHYGIGVHVLQPGQPNGLYHAENVQEDFLVLSGECLLIVEGQERRLKAWDSSMQLPGRTTSASAPATGPARFSWSARAVRTRRCTTR